MSNDSIFPDLEAALSEAISVAKGEAEPANVTRYEVADVKAIRTGVNASRKQFAEALDVSPETVKSWEQGRRNPTGLANKVLKMMSEDPNLYRKMTTV